MHLVRLKIPLSKEDHSSQMFCCQKCLGQCTKQNISQDIHVGTVSQNTYYELLPIEFLIHKGYVCI